MKIRKQKPKKIIRRISYLIFSIVLLVGLGVGFKYIYNEDKNVKMPIYKVDTDEKKVALTFDVAWGSENIEDIVKILEKHNIKSTFFLVGSWMDDNEKLVKMLDEKGHELSNHSNTHANMTKLSKEDIAKEIETVSQKIYDITGKKANLYRPPFGEVNNETMKICDSLGYQVIKWDVDSLDWKEIGPIHIVERVIKDSDKGSIVLLHANAKDIDKYLEGIITRLKEDKYELVTVSELLHDENYTVNSKGVQKIK